MIRKSLPLAIVVALPLAAAAQSVEWSVDKNHTTVGFVARHLGFAKVRGKFNRFTASAQADPRTGHLTSFEATIEAASVDTGVEKRDDDLRSDHFFAAARHPKIVVRSKSIAWKGDAFTGVVALTIRGNTRDVPFEGELLGVHDVDFGRGKHKRAAYEATAKINRRDFGLDFNGLAEGLSIVADDVKIEVSVEASYTPKK